MKKNPFSTDDEYIPYGPEWEKELMKTNKKFLIEMIRSIHLKRKESEEKSHDLLSALLPEIREQFILGRETEDIAAQYSEKYYIIPK